MARGNRKTDDIVLPEEYNTAENREAILTVINWKRDQLSKMAVNINATISTKGELTVEGLSDINVKPKFNPDNDSILMKRIRAKSLYSKDTCYCCGVTLIWDSDYYSPNNGRMYNGVNEDILDPDLWHSVCQSCNVKLNLPFTRLEVIDEINKRLENRQ